MSSPRRSWSEVWAERLRSGRFVEAEKLLRRFGAGGRWRASLGGRAGLGVVSFRYFPSDEEDFSGAVGRALRLWPGLARPAAPPSAGFPWLEVVWAAGRPADALLFGAGPGPEGAAVSRGLRGDAILLRARDVRRAARGDRFLRGLLRDLGRQSRVRDVLSYWRVADGGTLEPATRWALRLEDGIPWPSFARLDLAVSLGSRGTLLAYLIKAGSVSALDFDGGDLFVEFELDA